MQTMHYAHKLASLFKYPVYKFILQQSTSSVLIFPSLNAFTVIRAKTFIIALRAPAGFSGASTRGQFGLWPLLSICWAQKSSSLDSSTFTTFLCRSAAWHLDTFAFLKHLNLTWDEMMVSWWRLWSAGIRVQFPREHLKEIFKDSRNPRFNLGIGSGAFQNSIFISLHETVPISEIWPIMRYRVLDPLCSPILFRFPWRRTPCYPVRVCRVLLALSRPLLLICCLIVCTCTLSLLN